MSEIVKINGKEYDLVTNGISQSATSLIIQIESPSEMLEETEIAFSAAGRIEIENSGNELIAAYNGYNRVASITKRYAQNIGLDEDENAVTVDVVVLVLEKPDRIDALEDAVDALTMAILSDGDVEAVSEPEETKEPKESPEEEEKGE